MHNRTKTTMMYKVYYYKINDTGISNIIKRCVLIAKTHLILIFHICLLGIVCIIFLSCSSNDIITRQSAMASFKELSPKGGAEFYMENYKEYCFMDSLYRDSIMPAVLQCNYFDLDSVYNVLKGTSFNVDIEPVYKERKTELIKQIELEIEENSNKQREVLRLYYLPALEMSIDSMLDDDVDEIMNRYAGGFMNFRKLAFLFGRNRDDFKKIFWENFDTAKYQNQIKNYVESFYFTIKQQQSAYSKDLTGKDFDYNWSVSIPPFIIGLSQSTLSYVKKYTHQQSDEIIGEAIKDYAVPMVIGAFSGGLSTIYDISSTAYDIKGLVDDIKNTKINDDEMLKYVCSHDLSYQIKKYYIDKWIYQVYEQLEMSNKQLYNHIVINL